MGKTSNALTQAAVIGFGVPSILLLLAILILLPAAKEKQNEEPSLTQITVEPTAGDMTQTVQSEIMVLVDGEAVRMKLEDYVLGVVLAEMPASFEMEALKAQAVAARTYALKTCADSNKHRGAVCTSHQCCQSYMSSEDYLMRGWSEKYVLRVREAVKATAGQVLCYGGELIRATYFSCSGGSTEDAVAVWGREYPYLQSVKSPGEEETVYFTDTKEFTAESFQDAIGESLEGKPASWFGKITYTEGGGVDTIEIGGVAYRGTTLRALLGLRSTVFEVIASEAGVIFVTKGYGHRVGMSQYGADAMAMEGADYKQILAHYYIGAVISDYS